MKNSLLNRLSLAVLLSFSSYAQAQYFDNGKNVFDAPLVPVTPYNDIARDIATLPNLNMHITVGSLQKTSGGKYDGFVMSKTGSNQSLNWYVTIEGSGNDDVNGVDTRTVTSSTGHIYVTGSFTGSAQMILHYGFPIHHFTTVISTMTAPSGLANDATYFVTKLNENGGHIWTQVAGEPTFYNTEVGYDVDVNVVSGQVRVYTTGFYRSTPQFLSAAPTITVPTAGTSSDAIFVAQYTDNGSTANCNWVSTLGQGTFANDHGYGITSDPATGNVYMTGSLGGTLGTMTVTGNSDALIAKYNASGILQWADNFGGNGTLPVAAENDAGRGITFRSEASGNHIYVSGTYAGTGTFIPPAGGTLAGFFAKMKDNTTSVAFANKNTIIGTGTTAAYRNTISDDGTYWYVTGAKTGTATVRNNSTVVATLSPIWQPTVYDGFMVAFYTNALHTPTPYKDAEWLGGGEDADVASGVACMNNNEIYVCGSYKSQTLYTVDGVFQLWNANPSAGIAGMGTYDAYVTHYIPSYPKAASEEVATGIEETETTQVLVYPNPTIGPLVIQKKTDAIGTIEIMDVMGRLVFGKQTVTESRISLDLSSLAPGLYYLRLSEADSQQLYKVVKQ